MAKMFLVSTHLAFPQAHLLDASCAVGDGAEQAFDYLYPHVQARARSAHRAVLLDALTAQLDPEALDRLEPRLRPMLRFVGGAARARFGLCVEQVSDSVTPFDLQVHLCESGASSGRASTACASAAAGPSWTACNAGRRGRAADPKVAVGARARFVVLVRS